MRKTLLTFGLICLYVLSSFSLAQASNTVLPQVPLKTVRTSSGTKVAAPEKPKGKPLNSKVYLKQYASMNYSPFKMADIGFSKQTRTVSKELATLMADEKLYGNIIYSDDWQDYAIYQIPYGIYSFYVDETSEFNLEYQNIGFNLNAGVYANGKFYGIHPMNLFGSLNGIGYYVLNTETWQLEKSFIKDDYTYDDMASVMTFDPTTNTIFALRYNNSLTGLDWATLDTATVTFQNLNAWSGNFNMLTLNCTPDGTLYGIGEDGNLYTLDKTNGTPTLVGSTGVYPASYSQSAVYSGKTGNLIWSAITYTGTHMYSVDLSTGLASRLYSNSSNEQIVGMFIKDQVANDAAPSAITDLAVGFDAEGALTGDLSFTVPSTTYAGETLTQNVHVTVKTDGIIADEKDLAPGTNYSLSFDLTNDNHTFVAYASNEAGNAPVAILNQFVGYDQPKAVDNLTLSIEDGNTSLTWDVPVAGLYEGYLNPDSLFYKVYRMPGETLVAEHLTTNSFSEVTPTIMARYSYKVLAYNGVAFEGDTATSNEVIYGNGFVPPYEQKFETSDAFQYYNIIDANADGATWQLLYNVIALWPQTMDDNDWLITPALELEANVRYNLNFSTKALFSPAVERMKVMMGTSQTDTTTFTVELWNDTSINYYEYALQTVNVEVPSAGKYYFAFKGYSKASVANGLYIDDISVDVVGATDAPAMVEQLTITPDAADELKATVSFTTPSKTIQGTDLDEITAIHIYRNNDLKTPIGTISNPTAGNTIDWIDENVPMVGINHYTVIPENGFGEGEKTSAQAFVGVYTAPYSETFDVESSMEVFSFLNLNSTTSDWSYYNGGIEATNWMNVVDDWCFLPAIKLEQETVYEMSFDYVTYGCNTFQLTLGKTTNPEDQTVVYDFPNTAYYSATTMSANFETDEAGKYYAALNMTTDNSIYYYHGRFDNFRIEKVASSNAPGSVTNLSLVPGEMGEKSVTLSFNAPEEGYMGGDLDTITKIEVYRSSDLLPSNVFENPSKGEAVTWTDANTAVGYVQYAIVPYNSYGKGKMIIDSVFVGVDHPAAIADLSLKADAANANVTLSWEQPVTENGGYINYNDLKYNIYAYDGEAGEFVLYADSIQDTTLQVSLDVTGDMDIYYFAVSPVYDDYEAEAIVGHVVLGTPYSVPFDESFADMGVVTWPWTIAATDYAQWTTGNYVSANYGSIIISPQDNDNGLLFFYTQGGYGEGWIEAPKMTLFKKSVAQNVLRFWAYNDPNIVTEYSYLLAEISVDNEPFQLLGDTIRLNEALGWTQYSYNLDEYRNSNFVTLRFYAYVNSYYEAVIVDNVAVYSVFPEDLAVSQVSGDTIALATDTTFYNVSVQNVGSNAVDSAAYTVVLYNGEEILGSQTGKGLLPEETTSFTFEITPDVTEVGNQWQLTTKVEYSADQVTVNNTSAMLGVTIEALEFPVIDNLSAILVNHTGELSWSVPNLNYTLPETDGFENYRAFKIDTIGNWKVADLDSQLTYYQYGLYFDNAGADMAFQVWNSTNAGADYYEVYKALTDSQCLISWASAGVMADDESPVSVKNDDWLISPEIKLGTSLSLWAKQPSTTYGNEEFEIWVSSTTDEVSAFTKLDSVTLVETNWMYFEYDLPETTRYFAIRHISSAFALMLDDIAFTPVDAPIYQYQVNGYNVYRDNVKINEAPVSETMYADTLKADGIYTYAVSVVYENGESGLSNAVSVELNTTAVGTINSDAATILGGKGEISVINLQGNNILIYGLDGKQLADFNVTNSNQSYALPKGVYIAKTLNNEVINKVIVY